MNNPHRRSDEYMKRHYGIMARIELLAVSAAFACLILGASGLTLAFIMSWVRS